MPKPRYAQGLLEATPVVATERNLGMHVFYASR